MKKSGSNGQPPSDDEPLEKKKKTFDTSNLPPDWEEYVDDEGDPAENGPPPEPNPYKIGRGNPPKHTRFKRGKSGNPGGRPKGSKNMRTLIYELADEKVNITTNDGNAKVSVKEAAARKFLAMMMKGEFRYFKEFWEIENLEGKRLSDEHAQYREEQVRILHMLTEDFISEYTRGYKLVKIGEDEE